MYYVVCDLRGTRIVIIRLLHIYMEGDFKRYEINIAGMCVW